MLSCLDSVKEMFKPSNNVRCVLAYPFDIGVYAFQALTNSKLAGSLLFSVKKFTHLNDKINQGKSLDSQPTVISQHIAVSIR